MENKEISDITSGSALKMLLDGIQNPALKTIAKDSFNIEQQANALIQELEQMSVEDILKELDEGAH